MPPQVSVTTQQRLLKCASLCDITLGKKCGNVDAEFAKDKAGCHVYPCRCIMKKDSSDEEQPVTVIEGRVEEYSPSNVKVRGLMASISNNIRKNHKEEPVEESGCQGEEDCLEGDILIAGKMK